MDRTTAELRYLELDYVALPAVLRDTPGGARVSFRRLPSGAWIVQDWVIRMSRLGTSTVVRHAGGEVLRIIKPDSTVVYSRPLATVAGTVFDSTTGAGLARAVVSLPGTPYWTVSDSAGRFELAVPLEGKRAITFNHFRLDSLPLIAANVDVELSAAAPGTVHVGVPSEATLVARLCPGSSLGAHERVVVGMVRKQSGGRVPRATIVLTWQVARTVRNRLVIRTSRLTTHTDPAGWYTACGLPLDRPIGLYASDANSAAPAVSLRFARGGVTIDTGVWQAFSGRIWRQDLDVP